MHKLTKAISFMLSGVLAATMLAGCSSGEAANPNSPGGEDGVFTIAYAPNESTEQSADARNGLANDLSEALGCEVEEIQASDYNAIIEALRTGKADMAYMGPLALALGVERANVSPIVMKAEDGDPDKAIYHSVLVTSSKNDDIGSIADIKGRTMAFVDPDSTSGNLVPTAEIIKAFPDENLNSDVLHTNGAEGDVKVIHESGAIPAEAMVVAESVSQETRDKLTDFLTAYDNEEYFTQVIKKEGARFIACDITDYEPIIELNNIINNEEA